MRLFRIFIHSILALSLALPTPLMAAGNGNSKGESEIQLPSRFWIDGDYVVFTGRDGTEKRVKQEAILKWDLREALKIYGRDWYKTLTPTEQVELETIFQSDSGPKKRATVKMIDMQHQPKKQKFVVGQLGFMIGMYFQMIWNAYLFQDKDPKAIEAAWKSLVDVGGVSSLLIFSFMSQITTTLTTPKALDTRFRFWGPGMASNLGMAVGSFSNTFFMNFWSSPYRSMLAKDIVGRVQSTADFYRLWFGSSREEMDRYLANRDAYSQLRERIVDLKRTMKASPGNMGAAGELMQAQTRIVTLEKTYQEYRDRVSSHWSKLYIRPTCNDPSLGEEDIPLPSILTNKGYASSTGDWVVEGVKCRAVQEMGIHAGRLILVGFINQVLWKIPVAIRNILPIKDTETLAKILVRKIPWQYLPAGFDGRNYYDYFGRSIRLQKFHVIASGLVIGALHAMTFLGTDALVSEQLDAGEQNYRTGSANMNSHFHFAAANFLSQENLLEQDKSWVELDKTVKEFNKESGEFITRTILKAYNARFANWSKDYDKINTGFNSTIEYLQWLKRSYRVAVNSGLSLDTLDLSDQVFLENNGAEMGAVPWHVDPLFKKAFAKELNKYKKLFGQLKANAEDFVKRSQYMRWLNRSKIKGVEFDEKDSAFVANSAAGYRWHREITGQMRTEYLREREYYSKDFNGLVSALNANSDPEIKKLGVSNALDKAIDNYLIDQVTKNTTSALKGLRSEEKTEFDGSNYVVALRPLLAKFFVPEPEVSVKKPVEKKTVKPSAKPPNQVSAQSAPTKSEDDEKIVPLEVQPLHDVLSTFVDLFLASEQKIRDAAVNILADQMKDYFNSQRIVNKALFTGKVTFTASNYMKLRGFKQEFSYLKSDPLEYGGNLNAYLSYKFRVLRNSFLDLKLSPESHLSRVLIDYLDKHRTQDNGYLRVYKDKVVPLVSHPGAGIEEIAEIARLVSGADEPFQNLPKATLSHKDRSEVIAYIYAKQLVSLLIEIGELPIKEKAMQGFATDPKEISVFSRRELSFNKIVNPFNPAPKTINSEEGLPVVQDATKFAVWEAYDRYLKRTEKSSETLVNEEDDIKQLEDAIKGKPKPPKKDK